jgi:DNA polymerase III epsilon subunit-like protein
MIIIDVETTGPDPKKHSIVSVGAIDFLNPANQFYQESRVYTDAEIRKALLVQVFKT